jgi:hypothetical protein
MAYEFNDQEEIKNNNEFESYQNQVQPLSRNQKIAVGVLAFFGVFVLIFWAVQFNSNLKRPFQHNTSTSATNNSVDSTANSATAFNPDDEALKTKDTDGDGLSDWDEVHIYKTSPYLEDTDGDGYTDKQEIDTGNDPNCPRGQTCSSVTNSTVASSSNIISAEIINNNSANNQTSVITSPNASSANSNSLNTGQSSTLLSGKMDAKTLRKYLEDSGFDKSLLDQASDADLMATYSQTLGNASNQTSGNTN